MPSYETLFISADASVTGAQGYVYWRPGDPIYKDRMCSLSKKHTSVCVLLLLLIKLICGDNSD